MATANKNLSDYDKSLYADAVNFKIGIAVSDWNFNITQNLLKGTLDTLLDCGVLKNNILVKHVPGSFELVYVAKKLQSKNLDAVIVIGCLIRGETSHFDYVCKGVTDGIRDLNILNDVPVIFCVLTDNTIQQSIDRSGGKHGNKGVEAAISALKMINFNKDL